MIALYLDLSSVEIDLHAQEIMGPTFIFNNEEGCVQEMKGRLVKR